MNLYILKNALKSIMRSKGRNILIGIIIIVIASACTIILAIRNSAQSLVLAYQNKYEVTSSIGMNRDNLMNSFKEDNSKEDMIESFNNIESLTVEEIDSYGDSDYVKSYYYTYSLGLNSSNVESASDSLVKETTKELKMSPGGFGGITTTTEEIKNMKTESGEFTLIGYSSYEAMSEFINGSYVIVEGNVSSDFTSDTCVISEELATLNDLEVNDVIVLTSPNDEDIAYELTITGIYKENSEDASNINNMFSNSANNIITNNQVIINILDLDEDLNATINPTFILTSADVFEDFKVEVEEKGLSDYYTVTNNLEEVENATKSISSVFNYLTFYGNSLINLIYYK